MIQHEPIYEALNNENYRGSLKEAYKSKSMSPSLIIDRESESESSDSYEE